MMPSAAPTYRRPGQAERRRQSHRDYNARRPEEHKFYGSMRWRNFRRYLDSLPRFQSCEECGVFRGSGVRIVADHVLAFRDYPELALTESNIRPLCLSCHGRLGSRAGVEAKSIGCDAHGNPVGADDW